jgi:hypothetical protein
LWRALEFVAVCHRLETGFRTEAKLAGVLSKARPPPMEPNLLQRIREKIPLRVNSPVVLEFPWRNGCILESGSLTEWVKARAPAHVDGAVLKMALVFFFVGCVVISYIAVV